MEPQALRPRGRGGRPPDRAGPRSLPGLFWRGLVAIQRDDLAAGFADLRLVYFQQPGFERGGLSAAQQLRQLESALSDRGTPVDAAHRRVPSLIQEDAGAALDREDGRAAAAILDRVFALDPDHAEAHELAAQACDLLGRTEEADEHRRRRTLDYEARLREDPDDDALRHDFASFLASIPRSDAAGALDSARMAVELDPFTTEYRRTLAELEEKANRPDRAIEQLREALRLDPDDQDNRERLRALEARAARSAAEGAGGPG